MKFHKIFFALMIIVSLGLNLFGAEKIHDIQHSTNSGFDGTFPSKYVGKTVSVSGIVSKINDNGYFYIQDKVGGPWSGLLCADNRFSNQVKLNSEIIVSGVVQEHFGETCIKNIRNISVVSTDNELPTAFNVTINDMNMNEAYEGVLVTINAGNTTIRNNRLYVNDGTGRCQIELPESYVNFTKKLGQKIEISQVSGVIAYNCGEFKLQPRSGKDFVKNTRGIQNTSWGRVKSLYK
jgi:predicted extracellular nuclease